MTERDQGPARRDVGPTASRAAAPAAATVDRTSATARPETAKPAGRSTGGRADRADRADRARREQRAAPGTAPSSAQAPTRKASTRKPRRAQLRLSQVDAWSVMKTAFLLSIALGIVTVVAVGIVWSVLGAAGVFDSLNSTVQTVMGNSFKVQDYIGTGRVLGFTMLVSVVNVVLLTAIATLTAFLYNLAATLLGGVELTLTEDG